MYDVSFFEDEIRQIKDKGLRDLVYKAFDKAPAYFWYAPASSTGKYHPPDSNGDGGLCRHTLKVCWLAVCFARSFERDFDIHRSAGLLHDIVKFGIGDKMESGSNRPQYQNHAAIGAKWLWGLLDYSDPDPEAIFLRSQWAIVCDCVLTHMGRWGKRPPLTIDQQITHLADMAAADQHLVGIDFIADSKEASVEEPAQEKQYLFVREDGQTAVNFGKFYGRTPAEILLIDPGYVQWVLTQDFPEEVKNAFGGRGMKKQSSMIPDLFGVE